MIDFLKILNYNQKRKTGINTKLWAVQSVFRLPTNFRKEDRMKILIDTDWFSAIQDLQPSKQKEVLMAILNYPNGDSDTNLWKKTILPNLEKGKISYFNKLQNLKQNNPQKTNKKITDSVSESVIGSVSESVTDTTIREDKSREDKDKNKDIINNISEIKNNRFINEFTLFKAGFQGWSFPLEIRKVAAQHWSADEIRNIEKDFSCHEYETETTISDLLKSYPAKPKTTRFVKPTLEEVKAYCKERLNMVDAEKFVNYYESNGWKVGKNPMKDWKAAIRTWEKSTNTQQQSNILHLSARERQDLINKQKTAALLKALEEKGN